MDTKISGTIYAYASTKTTTADGMTWSGSRDKARFCVDIADPFTLADAKCEKPDHADYQWRTFGVIHTGTSGAYTWTLTD